RALTIPLKGPPTCQFVTASKTPTAIIGNQKKFTSNFSSQRRNHQTAFTGSEGISQAGIKFLKRFRFSMACRLLYLLCKVNCIYCNYSTVMPGCTDYSQQAGQGKNDQESSMFSLPSPVVNRRSGV